MVIIARSPDYYSGSHLYHLCEVSQRLLGLAPNSERNLNKMMWFKACPRCKQGDMALDEDNDRLCLQCGFILHQVGAPAVANDIAEMVRVDDAQTKRIVVDTAPREAAVAV